MTATVHAEYLTRGDRIAYGTGQLEVHQVLRDTAATVTFMATVTRGGIARDRAVTLRKDRLVRRVGA